MTMNLLKPLAIAAMSIAMLSPAIAVGAEIPKVYRGNWCQPVIHGGPFYNPGYCRNGEDEAWIKITARNVDGWLRVHNINGEYRDLSDAACRAIAIKPDSDSHLVTFHCDGVGTMTVQLSFVPRSADGRKSPRLYVDEVEK
jgi:hypothetical protein